MTNKFKFFILIGLSAILVTGAISCKKEWLKAQPLSFYEPSQTYTNAAAMRAALVSLARNLRFEYYGGNPAILTEMLFTEVAVEGTTDKSGPAQDLNTLITPDLVTFNNDDRNKIYVYWTEGYNGIKYANTIISRIDNATYASPAERNQILGAAYFHRALRYYKLVHQFGDVPAIMQEITAPKLDFYSTKKDVILQKIKLDLDSALLWSSDNVNRGEVTKGAVAHLLTKVNLALGDFDAAITAANAVINGGAYSLMKTPFGNAPGPFILQPGTAAQLPMPRNVIWDLHRPENKSLAVNKEGLFMIIDRFGDGQFNTGMTIMRQAVPYWGSNTNIITPTGKTGTNDNLSTDFVQSHLYGRGIGRTRPSNYGQYEIWDDPNDLRHAKGNWMNMEDMLYNDRGLKTSNDPFYLQNLQLKSTSGALLCKDTIRSYFGWPHYKLFVDDTENTPKQGGHSDWYMFRLAETYLLRAEAYLWKGDLASAAADINQVRTRANCAPINAGQVTMASILDERARELFYEENRKTELTRISFLFAKTGKPAENGKVYNLASFSENNYLYDRVIAKNNFYRDGVLTNYGTKYTISPYHVLWPVPTPSIEANSNGRINQNKGYNGFGNNIAPLDKIP